ncbi:MAG: nucleotide sugar dehydrogenase [Chloroflexi bacterium]|nr:nucleotide sugar dehydrogenase [Chloroflexota bacterium]
MDLADKISSRQANVSVIGLGYVGLPLAVLFAEAGFEVTGIDLDRARVGSINAGESYIQDVPQRQLARAIAGDGPGRLVATTDYEALREADAVVICVHTPLSKTKDPDVSYILSAVHEIAKRITPGMLIVLESTTYPGTTLELVLPPLERAREQSLVVGKDFFLAFSPERIDPGQSDWTLFNTPKVIGGVTPECTEVARTLYECVVDQVVPVSSPMVAEMVKLLENTFRATNIALVNEVAIMCDRLGINVWEVIDAAKTKPFGFMPFYPGPGLGGHCIPVDPQYLAWKLKTLNYNARFIQLAEEINLAMPEFWVAKTQDALNDAGKAVKGSNILVLGVAYKRDVPDTRESPALDIIEHLRGKGASVTYFDPHVPEVVTETFRLTSIDRPQLGRGLVESDCVVIVTDHTDFDWAEVRRSAGIIVDTRNALGANRGVPSAAAVVAAGANG